MKVLQGKQVTFDRFFPATTYFGGGYSHIDYLDIKSTSQVEFKSLVCIFIVFFYLYMGHMDQDGKKVDEISLFFLK